MIISGDTIIPSQGSTINIPVTLPDESVTPNALIGMSYENGVIGLNKARLNLDLVPTRASGPETLDASLNSYFIKGGGSGEIIITGMTEGQTVNVVLISIGTAYTVPWTFVPATTIKWHQSVIPIPTNASINTKYDIYTFFKLGGMIFGSASLNHG